ncbi:3-oxoacyl-[acyl-carrier-protein] synthase II [Murinocardiopsis flavida]|uniref:3-oxoacyl-[acyl-carrier-protein] synthase II n=1 Tax=Murinocardiopsis flavida TaxID=645275 RepID=A0A2P8DRZ4_9ACTN|nr:beta-ketoacyl-[acyl-carrier-protein] synthase family protein [Murinocardiopsis flavida]PSK99988.1 3-oxoacyl-[acyl-carrier-protein] synthase II [Murinocardiopsis flavida]
MTGAAPARVVVTGMGVVSSIALGVTEYLSALRAGRCGAAPVSLFDTSGFAHANGHQVADYDYAARLRRTDPAEWGRAALFAATAARMAVDDAHLSDRALQQRQGLVSIGTTDGGSHELDLLVAQEIAGGHDAMDGRLVRQVPAGGLSVAVARELGLTRVEAMTVATACSAGNHAIGDGLDALRSGEVEYALCGGADALCRRNFTGFYRLGLVAPDRCRPFDAERAGLLTGEGAGVLLLEEREAARARGARIHAEVLGYATNCDAYHQLTPNQAGIRRCMRLALDNARVDPADVDLISAHGTGTRTNDAVECGAIAEVFGGSPPPTVGLKGMLGHTMGAASALAGIASVLAIGHGFIPPTVNHGRTDPECAVDCVPNTAVAADPRVVQNNGFAFAGNNAVVVFGRDRRSGRDAA